MLLSEDLILVYQHLGVPQLQSRWNSQGNKEKTSS
jgi:hypothetical protein